jgi:uncharacterized protein (UPF0218 family)
VILSSEQRAFFQAPQGPTVQQPNPDLHYRLVVGDVVLETFLENRWPFALGIFDQHSARKPFYYSPNTLQLIKAEYHCKNPAGEIAPEAVDTMNQIFKDLTLTQKPVSSGLSAHFLEVTGEEDLLAVALVLLAPLKTEIYYGQPEQGIVQMIVTEELKQKFYTRLKN